MFIPSFQDGLDLPFRGHKRNIGLKTYHLRVHVLYDRCHSSPSVRPLHVDSLLDLIDHRQYNVLQRLRISSVYNSTTV